MTKVLGVIGGMGPEASSYFYEQVTAHTKADKDQDHLDIMMLSHASLPDRTTAIKSGQTEEIIRLLVKDGQSLGHLGASHIAIPCNTSHYFYDALSEQVDTPIINMVEETVSYAKEQKSALKKIGIMATDGTVGAGVYQKASEKYDLELIYPNKDHQKEVMSLIYDDIKAGKTELDHEKFNRPYQYLIDQGCEIIILACTELSVYKKHYGVPDNCLDALDVLVKESIIRSGATYK